MANCFVSYVDVSGIRHTVEVSADSLYEAAVLAVRILEQHDCAPGDMNALEVEIRSSVTHTLTLKKVKEWVNGGARTPKEAVLRDRLRGML